jgi:hypothetical protein
LDRRFASAGERDKVYDNACYFLLARFFPAEHIALFLKHEDALHTYKVLLRPDIGQSLCEFLGVDTLELDSIRSLHRQHTSRVRHSDWALFKKPELQRMAEAFSRQVIEDSEQTDSDKDHAATLEDERRIHATKRVKNKGELSMLDLLECAPLCVRPLLQRLQGPVEVQAKVTQAEHLRANAFLVEQKKSKNEVMEFHRPKLAIAYELSDPLVPHADFESLYIAAYEPHAAALEEWAQTMGKVPLPRRSCSDTMKCNECPLMKAQPAGYWQMAPEKRQINNKARFVEAKQKCHADLLEVYERRHAANRMPSNATKVKDWTMSPWAFAQTAARGDKHNPDKKLTAAAAAEDSSKRPKLV